MDKLFGTGGSHTLFEVAFLRLPEINGAKKGNHHNPTRQRGIYGDIGKTLQLNPSLTFRVMMAGNAQLQNSRFGL